jgi:hypothetical protein
MRYLGLLMRGGLIWLVPMLVSTLFYTPDGALHTSYALFKSAMVLVLTWTTLAVNLVRPPQRVLPALVVTAYLVVNLALDAIVLVPLLNLSALEYLEQIGLIYLIIPSLTYVLLQCAQVGAERASSA